MEQLLRWIRGARSILISGHARADGDCLGSQVVLYHAFRALGKEVRVLNPDPPDPRYRVLERGTPFEVYRPGADLPAHDALVVCDCCSLERLGAMAGPVAASGVPRACVDHHPLAESDRGAWDHLLHDAAAPASGLLAWRLAEGLGVPACDASRIGAFLALASDTGWFQHANSRPEVWSLAARLVAEGVRSEALHREVFRRCRPGHPRGIAVALGSVEYHLDGKVAVAWADPAEMAAAGARLEDSDEVLDLLRAVDGVEVVAFVHERDGRSRASLRSRGGVDVNAVARRFGGGGHRVAAGLSFEQGVGVAAGVAAVSEAAAAAL